MSIYFRFTVKNPDDDNKKILIEGQRSFKFSHADVEFQIKPETRTESHVANTAEEVKTNFYGKLNLGWATESLAKIGLAAKILDVGVTAEGSRTTGVNGSGEVGGGREDTNSTALQRTFNVIYPELRKRDRDTVNDLYGPAEIKSSLLGITLN